MASVLERRNRRRLAHPPWTDLIIPQFSFFIFYNSLLQLAKKEKLSSTPARHHSLPVPTLPICCQARRWLHHRHSRAGQTFSLQPSKHSQPSLVPRDLSFQNVFQLGCRAGLGFPCWPCSEAEGKLRPLLLPSMPCLSAAFATSPGTMNTLTVTV